MPGQVRKEHAPTRREDDVVAPTVNPDVVEKGEKIKGELDDLLDEIEGVLETNADAFVKSYVQKGGQ